MTGLVLVSMIMKNPAINANRDYRWRCTDLPAFDQIPIIGPGSLSLECFLRILDPWMAYYGNVAWNTLQEKGTDSLSCVIYRRSWIAPIVALM